MIKIDKRKLINVKLKGKNVYYVFIPDLLKKSLVHYYIPDNHTGRMDDARPCALRQCGLVDIS